MNKQEVKAVITANISARKFMEDKKKKKCDKLLATYFKIVK